MGFDVQGFFERAIRNAPDVSEPVPPQLEAGQGVTHRWKRKTHGTIVSISKGMVFILNNFEEREPPVPISQFYDNWSIVR